MEDTTNDAAGVLAQVRELRAAERATAAALLRQAAVWADLHPALDPAEAASVHDLGQETDCPIAGSGTPQVSAESLAELAAALGMSTGAGARLVGQALELRHRLPRLWAQVHAHAVPAWVARSVADRTMVLSVEAAGFVDTQVCAVAGRVGAAQLDRLVTTAIQRHMPEEAERRRQNALEGRCFAIEHDRSGRDHALSSVWGTLDLPDALALEAAVQDGAQALASAGCTDSLDVRRARAVGELARRQPALDLLAAEQTTVTGVVAGKAAERVVLYLHLSAAALGAGASTAVGECTEATGRVENTGAPVTAEQIRDWCARPDARVSVKPVIDLNAVLATDAYRPTTRMREQIALRDRTCVFPWCSRPAHPYPLPRRDDAAEQRWSAEDDHIVAWDSGGPTSSDNLAPLCRAHHRLKTFTGWRHTRTGPGCYDWTSPHGYRYRRHPDGGTNALTPDTGPPRRRPRQRPTARADDHRRTLGPPIPVGAAGPPDGPDESPPPF
ncbi:HNH endonuclease signature motif containing protein [Desertihabitans aurantiacus]|uniref:HNH endonuclease signature motif containing protein n=1 Tax=Desertihabitans aurantiacus TaxID=2282477 RepID=UPI000DF77320|nr:HNH endonuclease signature motif containing protein [Desertihabitans aurantiacus]